METLIIVVFCSCYFIVAVAMTVALSIVAIKVQSALWVRNGYAGKDEILELKEVDRYIAHCVMWGSLALTFFLASMEPLLKYFISQSVVAAIGFVTSFGLGSGIYVAIKKKPAHIDEETPQ